MGRLMHPSVGMSLPAADTNLSADGVVFVFVLRFAATLSSISEIEDPESNIIFTSLLSNTPRVTAALGWTAAATTPADLVGLSSWDAPAPSGTSLGSFPNSNLEQCGPAAHINSTFLLKDSSFVNGLAAGTYNTQQLRVALIVV